MVDVRSSKAGAALLYSEFGWVGRVEHNGDIVVLGFDMPKSMGYSTTGDNEDEKSEEITESIRKA